MESLGHLLSGFAAALSWYYLLYAFAGCVLGTLIGVLPGLGPAAGTAILIPLTFNLDATGAIIMLSAIYYGAMYGGTITSVLINVPGEAASVRSSAACWPRWRWSWSPCRSPRSRSSSAPPSSSP
jgi:putative tricarboxylic transport membrane protein